MQPRSSTSSLQHNVVLHSNVADSSSPSLANRFELNTLQDKDVSRRKTNSLMTVHEQEAASDLLTDESWSLRSPADANDAAHPGPADAKETVSRTRP